MTVETLGASLKNLDSAKMTTTAKGRLVSNFVGTAGGFAGGPIDFLVGLVGAFLGDLADDASTTDISGPEDLPDLIESFFEGLPLVGLILDIKDAMTGEYTGDDPVLLAIQALFAPLRKLVEIVTGAVSGIGAAVGDVVGFFDNLRDYLQGNAVGVDPPGFFAGLGNVAQSLVDQIAQGLGAVGSGHSFDDVRVLLASTSGRLSDVEAAVASLEAVLPAYPVTPSFVSDVQDMASCSRNACKVTKVVVSLASDTHSHGTSTTATNGSLKPNAGNTAIIGITATDTHTHTPTVTVTTVPATYSPKRYVNTFGVYESPVDYVPIVVDRRGTVDKLRWKTGDDASLFGIDAYYMALCIYNASTGAIEKVWDSGNIKDTVANVSGSSREVEMSMGISQICTPGQLLFVAHQQIAPGALQGTRSIGCEPLSGDGRPSSLAPLDGAMLRTPGRHGSIPSTIQASTLTRINTQQMWAAVSVLAIEED